MKKVFEQLQENKGMSLLEILISVAISMIVMVVAATFISNGSIFFKKQSENIDVQKELMECSNKINDALLQSTDTLEINVGSAVNGAKIYTGSYDTMNNKFTSGKGYARLIEWNSNNQELYVMDVLQMSDAELKKGYRMGQHVSNVAVSISDDCAVVQLDGSVRYEQPLILEVQVTITDKNETRSDYRVVTLRNKLNVLKINGVTYIPNEDGLLTKSTSN